LKKNSAKKIPDELTAEIAKSFADELVAEILGDIIERQMEEEDGKGILGDIDSLS
jgi:hypothetical protein